MQAARIISTLAFAGLSPVAPGTIGSLVTALACWPVYMSFGLWGLLIFCLFGTGLGFAFVPKYLAKVRVSDPQEVVIDEFSGQSLAIIGCLVCRDYALTTAPDWLIFVVGFLLFRLFDITKIFPVSYFDAIDSTFGIMMDDIVAGLMAILAFYLGCIPMNSFGLFVR